MFRPPTLAARGLVACLALGASAPLAAATDWPAFRGAAGDGLATAPVLAGAGLAPLWKRPLGSGYSAIVTAGEVGVTMAADGTHDVVIAFDLATGKDLWRRPLAPAYKGHDGSDDGPISTPAIAGDVVFALAPRGELAALRLTDGNPVWTQRLAAPALRVPFYGVATSPVISGELVIVATGGEGGRAVTAFRRADGTVAWTWGDDTVDYTTPLIATVAGESQLLVFSNSLFAGLDPATGRERWSHRHTQENGGYSGQLVALGNDRFLAQMDGEALAFAVDRDSTAFVFRELWRAPVLRNFAIPVVAGGSVFGISGQFLSAIDPATGAARWKSRPPGGRGLVAVAGHLVMVGAGGDVVIARASPRGYEEVARAKALSGDTLSIPAVVERPSGGLVLVRNLTEMAALRLVAGQALAAPAAAVVDPNEPAPVSQLAALVASVDALPAADTAARQRVVDAFWGEAGKGLPLIEPSGKVSFVARAQSDVGLGGNWQLEDQELPLRRLAGTDLFYRTVTLDPAAQYEYRLSVDFADPAPDPGNPLTIGSGQGPGSELRMPGFRVPPQLRAGEAKPTKAGRLDKFEIDGKAREGKREISVYLPAGYDAAVGQSYPLVIVNHGAFARDHGTYPALLDGLIASGLEPLVVALVPRQGGQEYVSEETLDYARYLAEELLPELARRYRLRPGVESRAILGVGSGAQAAVVAAFSRPGTYGFLAVQSFYRFGAIRDQVPALVAKGSPGLRAYVELATGDMRDPRTGLDAGVDSRALVEQLKAAGVPVAEGAVAGPGSWGRWRSTLDLILAAFAATP